MYNICILLVSDDFVQDPPDEEEKSMKRKFSKKSLYIYIYILYGMKCSLPFVNIKTLFLSNLCRLNLNKLKNNYSTL